MAVGTDGWQDSDFTESAVWVTGASRGLGAAVARAFAAAGAVVFATSRDQEALADLAASADRAAGGEIRPLAASVTSTEEIEQAAAQIAAERERLDVLVANAGISPTFVRPEKLADEDWMATLETNLAGAFRCCRAAKAVMGEGSSIVNVSSAHSVSGHGRLAAYAASKGGLESLTRCLAVEWADAGIRVNAVAPGYIKTEMTSGLLEHEHWSNELLGRIPLGRFAEPADVVDPILFLASDKARYITGTTLFVDGGWTAQ